MDKVHKRAITKCRSKIVIDLSFENEFWDKLAEQEIFTLIMLEVIQVCTWLLLVYELYPYSTANLKNNQFIFSSIVILKV
jgi:hypothetical protein